MSHWIDGGAFLRAAGSVSAGERVRAEMKPTGADNLNNLGSNARTNSGDLETRCQQEFAEGFRLLTLIACW